MKNIKRQILIALMTLCFGTTFSQTADSLSVFPNPFDNAAIIHFDIIQSDTITLRVFSATGQMVKTLFQSTILPSGSYNINLLGDSLVVGVYFVRLDIGSTKNMTETVIKIDSTTGITDNEAVDQVLVYPNPTNNRITIPVTGNKTIRLTDINGKIIKSFKTDQQVVSLMDLAPGQYIITVFTNKNEMITTQKIIKIE